MQVMALLAAAVLAGPADDLVAARVEGLRLRVPAAWSLQVTEQTHHYVAPSEDGGFDLSVFSLPPRHPRLCLDQLLEALGGERVWKRMSVGGEPAATRVAPDGSEKGLGDYATNTYVGCNGRIKWVMTFASKNSRKDRFEPLAAKILESVEYPPPAEEKKKP